MSVYYIYRISTIALDFHKLMTRYKFLLEQAIGAMVVGKHANYATVLGHDDIDITLVGFPMQLSRMTERTRLCLQRMSVKLHK